MNFTEKCAIIRVRVQRGVHLAELDLGAKEKKKFIHPQAEKVIDPVGENRVA